jgi:hypothetical protein
MLEYDFNSFKLVMFDIEWYRLRMHEHDEERTVIQHANRFSMIKTTMFERGDDRYVFLSQCEQVFYSNVLGERDWSFVVRYDPRGRPVKYTHVQEEDDIEEEDDYPYQRELEDHVGSTDKEDEEDHDAGIGDNIAVLDDDVDDNMLENDIDDDDDIVNPFNVVSEPDDDTYVDFDEEEDIE